MQPQHSLAAGGHVAALLVVAVGAGGPAEGIAQRRCCVRLGVPALRRLPRFVTTTGGEYVFMPGIRALHWLAELPS